MRIAIATDTNSSITQEEANTLGVFLLPMPFIIEKESYFEGVDITNDALYEAMKELKDISTSQPSPGQLLGFWDDIFSKGYDKIVHIPMSSGLSNSCNSAKQLAKEYGDKVIVVDNHRISVTLKSAVICALQLLKDGKSAEEIKAILEEDAYSSTIFLVVDSLDYLKKGGRITSSAAALGSLLHIKPILTTQGDAIEPYTKVRTLKKAEKVMIEAIQKERNTRFSNVSDEKLCVYVAGTYESKEQAEHWRMIVQEAFPQFVVTYMDLPCSIACHVGRNAAGIALVKEI